MGKYQTILALSMGMSGVFNAVQATPLSGINLSGELGYGIGNVEHRQEAHSRVLTLKSSDTKLAPSGIIGNVALGYSWQFPRCFVLGADVYGGLSSMNVKHWMGGDNPDIQTTIKMRNTFGFRARPGVMITRNTLLHGTLGIAWSQWKITASDDTDAATLFRGATLNKRVGGFSYGAGMMSQVSPQLGVGIEFTRTTYKKLPDMNQLPIAPAAVAAAGVYKQTFKPSTNTIVLRFVYGL